MTIGLLVLVFTIIFFYRSKKEKQPFAEYETITVEDIDSQEFGAKYSNIFLKDCKLVKSSAPVFEELGKKMNKSPKAVYLIIKRKFLPENKEKVTVSGKPTAASAVGQIKKSTAAADETISPGDTIGPKEQSETVDRTSFEQSFVLEKDEIFTIIKGQTKNRGRSIDKLTLVSGWPQKLAKFLVDKTKLSCKFSFQKMWVNKLKKVTIDGKCDCGSFLDVTYEGDTLKIGIKEIDSNYPHKRRYQIRGERKNEVFEVLNTGKSALAAHSNLINEQIPDNDTLNSKFNPLIPELNAVRCAKYRRHETNNANPIDVLLDWKETKFTNVISAISVAPFFIFYRTPLQLAWYLVESRKNRISISIDATGSLVQPPLKSEKIQGTDKLKHVFLYTIMAKTGSKSVPIAQMLSQDQSSDFITFFLKKMFRELKAPAEIVCDESKALLKALCTAFTSYDKVEDYINACINALEKETEPPNCSIRIDVSHFVKNVTRKIKDRDFRRRNLFRGVIGFLIKCDNFSTAKEVIKDFFTLIMNESDGVDEYQHLLPSEEAKKRLIALCRTHDENIDYAPTDTEVDESEESDKDDPDLSYNANSTWVKEIVQNVDIRKSDDYHESIYFCTEKERKMYEKLFSSIVLWSNVTNTLFGSSTTTATSSDSESYFKSLKTGILTKPLYRVDEFLELHLNFINSEIKLSAMSSNAPEPEKRKRSNSFGEQSSSISSGEFQSLTTFLIRF